MGPAATAVGAPHTFVSRDPEVLRGALWLDPAVLADPRDTARALKALADFDAYSAAMRALLVNQLGEQIAQEPLEGRDGQPTRLGGDLAHAATVSEVALLQGISEAAAGRMVNFARALVTRHPCAHEVLLSGDATEAHMRVLVEQADTLPEPAAERFGLEAVGKLRTRRGHLRTPGEYRSVVKALRERLHPESVVHRRARAATDRGVWVQPEDDGMCTLTALLPAEAGLAAYRRIDAIAQTAHATEGECRTRSQLRADALAQALLEAGGAAGEGGTAGTGALAGPGPTAGTGATPEPGAPTGSGATVVPVPVPEDLADLVRAQIVVHIPAAVLLGASDEPAELERYGVIDAHTARELAAAAPTWHRVFTDENGVPVRLARTVYRPPEPLRRFIRYRDGVCLVPGCTRPGHRCEVDHTIEWQDGGTTDADNLALLCPQHHALKSLALFMLGKEARGEGGDGSARLDGLLVWTTLLGFEHPAEPLERDHILGPRGISSAADINRTSAQTPVTGCPPATAPPPLAAVAGPEPPPF